VTSFGSFSIEQIWNSDCSQSDIHDLAQKITETKSDVAFLSLCWERVDPAYWLDKLNKLITLIEQSSPHTRIELILDSVYQHWIDAYRIKDNVHVTFIDFFAVLLWHRVVELKQSSPCKEWNQNNKNFLFLTGKPDKVNRIRLLYKFHQQQLLYRGTWSLFHNEYYKKQCKPLLNELTDKEYTTFVNQHTCNPDSIVITDKPNGTIHYSGVPFDTLLYQNSVFQVVSETSFLNKLNLPVWITEKTWLAILNNQPFIIAGDLGTLKKLKQLGFKTFDQYLLIKDYDNIDDSEHRLDAIVKNTNHWLDNISNNVIQIQNDIKHNFQQFCQLVNQSQLKLTKRIVDNGLDCKINNILLLVDPHLNAEWQHWYERVRDKTWPDCASESDFWTLPEHIRTECIEIFGYKPKEKI